MSQPVTRITVLVENTVHRSGLLAEHGLAFWIERGARRILFDTGQGLALSHNAKTLGIDLSIADALVLSHGHYDHTGGLFQSYPQFNRTRVYAHATAFDDRFIQDRDGRARSVRCPIESAAWLTSRVGAFSETGAGPIDLGDGLWLTGEIPRTNDFEDTGGAFYLDEACTQADPLLDDQAMFMETAQGIVVLLGCAHAGVVNTLEYIRASTGQARIHAVLGGMHLLAANDDRMARTIHTLRQMDIQSVGLAHCTGFAAMVQLYQELAKRCFHCVAGTRIELD